MSSRKSFKSSISYDQKTKDALAFLIDNGININYEFRQFILAKAKEVKNQIQEENF